MNTVEPIRDIELVEDISAYLRDISYRDHVLFNFGIYTGLRISDILQLKVRDVREKTHVYIREQKTGRERLFLITEELREILEDYIKDKKDYEYLFKSRKRSNKGLQRPISREQAYRILNKAAKYFGLENIGTHTLRKTFGYHMHKYNGASIEMLRDIFNHSSVEITKRYIGINQDEKDEKMRTLTFRKRKRYISKA